VINGLTPHKDAMNISEMCANNRNWYHRWLILMRRRQSQPNSMSL